MWRLWNKLFGWDYVYWSHRGHCIISRVKFSGNGKPYFKAYRCGFLHLIDEDSYNELIWLTCKPEKYFEKG